MTTTYLYHIRYKYELPVDALFKPIDIPLETIISGDIKGASLDSVSKQLSGQLPQKSTLRELIQDLRGFDEVWLRDVSFYRDVLQYLLYIVKGDNKTCHAK